jgi:hypothetical protein
MANLITHVYFAEEVLKALPEEIRAAAEKRRDAYIFGSVGPDFLFVLRELKDKADRYTNEMQYNKAYEVFSSIARYIAEKKDPAEVSYALGLMCHYVLDFKIHAYVNYFVEEGNFGLPQNQRLGVHSMIENAVDDYLLRERMGYKDGNLYNPAKHIRTKKRTNRAIANVFTRAVNKVLGFDVPRWKFYFSIKVMRLFVSVLTDPSGKKRAYFSKKEKNNSSGKKKLRNMFRPPEFMETVDFLNFQKRPWFKARGREETENYSAPELLDASIPVCVKYIRNFFAAIGGAPLNREDFEVNYEGVFIGEM